MNGDSDGGDQPMTSDLPERRHRNDWRQRSRIGDRDGWTCRLCREPIDRYLPWPDPCSPSTEHIIPVSQGGTDDLGNLAIAHLACNIASNDRTDHTQCVRGGRHYLDGTCRPRLREAISLAEAVRGYCRGSISAWQRIPAARRTEITALYGAAGRGEADILTAETRWAGLIESGRTRLKPGPAWRLGEADAGRTR